MQEAADVLAVSSICTSLGMSSVSDSSAKITLSLSLSLSLSLASLFHCARNCKVSNHRTRTRMHEEGREREREKEREREREEVDRARERADRELSARIYVTQRCNQRTRGDRKTRSLPFSPSAPAGRRIVHKFRFYSRERENNDR